MSWRGVSLMAELCYILRDRYQDSFDSLKNTSYDKEHNIFMCQSPMEVINFDKLTEHNANGKKLPKSFDALICDEEEKKAYCIEFKNQEKSIVNNKSLQEKMIEGKNTLDRIMAQNKVQRKNYQFIFCVAYKPNPNHYRYRRKIEERTIYFNLERQEHTFDKIITKDIVFFTDQFRRKYECQ
jgi:hypothetical protein